MLSFYQRRASKINLSFPLYHTCLYQSQEQISGEIKYMWTVYVSIQIFAETLRNCGKFAKSANSQILTQKCGHSRQFLIQIKPYYKTNLARYCCCYWSGWFLLFLLSGAKNRSIFWSFYVCLFQYWMFWIDPMFISLCLSNFIYTAKAVFVVFF